jgi:hypothetical protein
LTSLFTVPHSDTYARVSEILLAMVAERGLDFVFGLFRTFFNLCGFASPEVAFIQVGHVGAI